MIGKERSQSRENRDNRRGYGNELFALFRTFVPPGCLAQSMARIEFRHGTAVRPPLRRLFSRALIAGVLLSGFTVVATDSKTLTLGDILAARRQTIASLGVRAPHSLEIRGTIDGVAMRGTFQLWRDGDLERLDELMGIRHEERIRLNGVTFVQNTHGEVRALRGVLARRDVTRHFIDSGQFAVHPEADAFLGQSTLFPDRSVYRLRVSPAGGQPEEVDIDSASLMIDRVVFDDGNTTRSIDYYRYRVVDGSLVAYTEVQSNGDETFDIARVADRVEVNGRMNAALFRVPPSNVVSDDHPVTVPMEEHDLHYYVKARLRGHDVRLLLDSGSQGLVIDAAVARRLRLVPQGETEIYGVRRMAGNGDAAVSGLTIGGAQIPCTVASIVDLQGATGNFQSDGILGSAFFGAAEIRIDTGARTLTFGRPGTLPALGTRLRVDADRELFEVPATVLGATGTFLVDTGNSDTILIFYPFLQRNRGLIPLVDLRPFEFAGVGGSSEASQAPIGEFDIGTIRIFNRRADILPASTGSFADRFDAGNIGLGVLQDFISTFDLQNDALYLAAR